MRIKGGAHIDNPAQRARISDGLVKKDNLDCGEAFRNVSNPLSIAPLSIVPFSIVWPVVRETKMSLSMLSSGKSSHNLAQSFC
jgi:hypothetical protein